MIGPIKGFASHFLFGSGPYGFFGEPSGRGHGGLALPFNEGRWQAYKDLTWDTKLFQPAAAWVLAGSISMRPLNWAPSSMLMRAVEMSPMTEPSVLMSTRSVAKTLPTTLP